MSSFNRSESCRPRRLPVSISAGTTSTTTTRFGSAETIAGAQPVAIRLMTALASATRSAEGSVKQVSDPIGLTPFELLAAENLAQFDAIEPQETGKLAFAQQFPPVCLSREQVQP